LALPSNQESQSQFIDFNLTEQPVGHHPVLPTNSPPPLLPSKDLNQSQQQFIYLNPKSPDDTKRAWNSLRGHFENFGITMSA